MAVIVHFKTARFSVQFYGSTIDLVPNSDVTVLKPKKPMTIAEKIFYATCITQNRFKFSYGRKPKGKRLMQLEVPDRIPHWVAAPTVEDTFDSALEKIKRLSVAENAEAPSSTGKDMCRLDSVFDVKYGLSMELNALEKDLSGVNFVSRTSKNNGVSARVKPIGGIEPIDGGVLTVAASGSVLETFLQLEPFYSGRDLFYLKPKEELSVEELLFYCVCIRENRFRYSYGRQANRTLKELPIPSRQSIPSWVYGVLERISGEYKEKMHRPLESRA
jgi:hypothetical protein